MIAFLIETRFSLLKRDDINRNETEVIGHVVSRETSRE